MAFDDARGLIQQEWQAMRAWSAGRTSREVRRFQEAQPIVSTYVFAMLEDESLLAGSVSTLLARTLDAVYQRVLGGPTPAISEEAMTAAATQVEGRFEELGEMEPELALRRLLQNRDLAAPDLAAEMIAVLMEAVDDEPELEHALGGMLMTMLAVAMAYERAHGIAADGVVRPLEDSLARVAGRSLPKVGRNDPCPCGSGRKFKKCCGDMRAPAPPPPTRSHPEELFHRYMSVTGILWEALHERDDDRDGQWVRKQSQQFEHDFDPGEDDGVQDSLHVQYILFDLVIPQRQKSFAALQLERRQLDLSETEQRWTRHLCASYAAFHQVTAVLPEQGKKRLRELVTGIERLVSDVEDPRAEEEPTDEIWLCRVVGPADDAVITSSVLVYPPSSRAEIEAMIRDLIGTSALTTGSESSIGAAMKKGLPVLADYILQTAPAAPDPDEQLEDLDLDEDEDTEEN